MKHLGKLSVFSLVLFALISFKDDNLPFHLEQKLKEYVSNYPQEKVYIHFDRYEYFTGEEAWFKVYLLDGITHRRDSLSMIVYVDFLDEDANLIQQKRIRTTDGLGDGNFTIPDTRKFQIVTVKAYTSWMRNFNTEYFFEQKLKVFSSGAKRVRSEINSYDFQLLPESGYLASGVTNFVGIKGTDRFGKGIDFTGRVLEEDAVVAEFAPTHNGMGKFEFTPSIGKRYTYEVTFPDGTTKKEAITGMQSSYVLQVNNSQVDFLNLNILTSPEHITSSDEAWLILQSKGNILFAANVKLSKPLIEIPVAKFTLPTGIVQCMLFNSDGLPKAERLVYIEKPNENDLTIQIPKRNYYPREETEVNILLKDKSGNPASGEFSMSVIDLAQVDPSGEFQSYIADYLRLSSEIPGYIQSPGYYFDASNPKRMDHLDLLLMTQGWRRFSWDKILDPQEPKYDFYIERGFAIAGQLTNLRGRSLDDGDITMMIYGDRGGFQSSVVNEDGFFAFYDIDITDSTQIFLQGKNGKGNSNVKIKIDTSSSAPEFFLGDYAYNTVKENTNLEKLGNERINIREAFNLSERDQVLDEVIIKGSKPDPLYARKHNQLYPVPQKRLNLDDFAGIDTYQNIFHFLRGRVPGMQITGSIWNPNITSRGSGTNGTVSIQNNQALMVLVDGVPYPIDVVTSIPIQRIETVDVINASWASVLYGSTGGLIAIYLKDGVGDPIPTQGTVNFTMSGYSINKEFYKIDYTDDYNLAIPDFRATLHWEPYVSIDSTGNYSVRYFNSDLETEIMIIVEGITDSGEPLYSTLTYEILK